MNVHQLQQFQQVIQEAEVKLSRIFNTKISLRAVGEDEGTFSQKHMKQVRYSLLSSLIQSCCEAIEIKRDHVIGPSKKTTVLFVRYSICHLAKETIKGVTLKEIGEKLGGRDHTTIINALNNVEDLLATNNQEFASIFYRCQDSFLNNQKEYGNQ